jgi:hypothetical protein
MGKHMAETDVALIESFARKKGATPTDIIEQVQKVRAKKKHKPLSETAIRRVLRGEAYHRGKVERRGRPKKATTAVIKTFEKSRKKLLKKAKSTVRVTYAGVMEDAGLEGKISVRRLQPAVNEEEDIAFRPGVHRPHRTDSELEQREDKAGAWVAYSKDHWMSEIHGYIDNKTFKVCRSPVRTGTEVACLLIPRASRIGCRTSVYGHRSRMYG